MLVPDKYAYQNELQSPAAKHEYVDNISTPGASISTAEPLLDHHGTTPLLSTTPTATALDAQAGVLTPRPSLPVATTTKIPLSETQFTFAANGSLSQCEPKFPPPMLMLIIFALRLFTAYSIAAIMSSYEQDPAELQTFSI